MFRVILRLGNYKFDYLVISTFSQMHTHKAELSTELNMWT